MGTGELEAGELLPTAESALEEAASRLRWLLAELAARLQPFPAFLGMATIQAVELEPAMQPVADRGCVVVTPDGEIRELDLTAIPGISGVTDTDQVEEFKELQLPAEEYILYAMTAMRLLAAELRRRR